MKESSVYNHKNESLTKSKGIFKLTGRIFSLNAFDKKGGLLKNIFIFQALLMGVFLGSYHIAVHSLFLNAYQISFLPNAFVYSALIGIAVGFIYHLMLRYVSFNILLTSLIFIIFTGVVVARFGFNFWGYRMLVYALFLGSIPLSVLGLQLLKSLKVRLYGPGEGYKVQKVVNIGFLSGLLLAGLSVVTLHFINIGVSNVLISGTACLIPFVLLVYVVDYKKLFGKTKVQEIPEGNIFRLITNFHRNQLIVFILLFTIFSSLTAGLIHFVFLDVIRDFFDELDLLSLFVAIYFGGVIIFGVLVRFIFYDKIVNVFGNIAGLFIAPAVTLILIGTASVIGIYHGYTIVSQNFLFFFIAILTAGLFSKVIYEIFERPSLFITCQPLNEPERNSISSFLNFFIFPFGILLSGLTLFLLIHVDLHVTIFIIFASVIWMAMALGLFKVYRKTLKGKLRDIKPSKYGIKDLHNASEFLLDELDNKSLFKKVYILKLMEIIHIPLFEKTINNLLDHHQESMRLFALRVMQYHGFASSLTYLKGYEPHEKNEELKSLATNIIKQLNREIESKERRIEELARSIIMEDRISAVRLIGDLKNRKYIGWLQFLLRDPEKRVRIEAIKTAGKAGFPETALLLTEYLATPEYYQYAFHALVDIGDMAVEPLDQTFNNIQTSENIKLRVVKILGLVGGSRVLNSLLVKIDDNNRLVVYEVAKCLLNLNYTANREEREKILVVIQKFLGQLAWNTAALYSLQNNVLFSELANSIEGDYSFTKELVIILLSIAYDPKTMDYVRSKLNDTSYETNDYALELLSVFVAKDIFLSLKIILSSVEIELKVRRLQDLLYPVEKMGISELISGILNRDYYSINPLIKAIAMDLSTSENNQKVSNDLLAHIFNPDDFLSETAAYVVHKIDKDIYTSSINRLFPEDRNRLLERIRVIESGQQHIILDRIRLLKQMEQFKSLSGYELAAFASILEEWRIEPQVQIVADKFLSDYPIIILLSGKIVISSNESNILELRSREIFDMRMVDTGFNKDLKISVNEETIVFVARKEDINSLLFDFDKLVVDFINVLHKINLKKHLILVS